MCLSDDLDLVSKPMTYRWLISFAKGKLYAKYNVAS